jgi:hypothetical protein
LFRNGTQVAAVASTLYTFSGLACGTTYTLGIAAIDAVQNQSQQATVSGATLACGSSTSSQAPAPSGSTGSETTTTTTTPSSAAPDTVAPSVPGGLVVSGVGPVLVGLSWHASTDNVGVAGYRLYRGGVQVATTSATSYVFTGLTCATSYTLAVAAVDAAGNLSAQASLTAKTAACTPVSTPGPTGGTLAVAPGGSDTNPCTLQAPCASFDHAYHRAIGGQTVQVAAGSYGPQTITADPTKTGPDVLFSPAGPVTVSLLSIGGSHLTFQNMTAIWKALPTANTITLRNITSPGAIYITGGATNISIIGGQVYSPVPVSTDSQIASLYGKAPTNILFDGVSFHDFRDIGPGNLHHIECLQVGGAVNLTIQNSTFQNCETHDLFIRSWGFVNNSPYPLTNILIKNNTFAPTYTGYYSMQVLDDLWTGQPPTSVTIANNTFQQGTHVYITHGTALITGNTLPAMSAFLCNAFSPTTTLTNNTYVYGTPCGTNSTVLNPVTSPNPPPSGSGSTGTSGH